MSDTGFRLRIASSMLCVWMACAAQAKDVLVVGTTFARIYEQTERGEFIGLGAELARSIAQQQGLTLKLGIYPWARAQEMVANCSADVLGWVYGTPFDQERANLGVTNANTVGSG